jgi:hypothetical protein
MRLFYLFLTMRLALKIILLFLSTFAFAQKQKILHVGLLANSYKGDFASYQSWSNAVDLGLSLNKDKFLTGEFSLKIGRVTAQNLVFESPIANYVQTNFLSFNYGLKARIFSYKDKLKVSFTPGLGLVRFNPMNDKKESLSSLSSSRKKGEEFSNVSVLFPLKLELEYFSKYGISYTLQSGFLNTRTDYLDNISQLANAENKDNIFFLGLGIGIPVGKKQVIYRTN